jgi:hypothetical protein
MYEWQPKTNMVYYDTLFPSFTKLGTGEDSQGTNPQSCSTPLLWRIEGDHSMGGYQVLIQNVTATMLFRNLQKLSLVCREHGTLQTRDPLWFTVRRFVLKPDIPPIENNFWLSMKNSVFGATCKHLCHFRMETKVLQMFLRSCTFYIIPESRLTVKNYCQLIQLYFATPKRQLNNYHTQVYSVTRFQIIYMHNIDLSASYFRYLVSQSFNNIGTKHVTFLILE